MSKAQRLERGRWSVLIFGTCGHHGVAPSSLRAADCSPAQRWPSGVEMAIYSCAQRASQSHGWKNVGRRNEHGHGSSLGKTQRQVYFLRVPVRPKVLAQLPAARITPALRARSARVEAKRWIVVRTPTCYTLESTACWKVGAMSSWLCVRLGLWGCALCRRTALLGPRLRVGLSRR